MEADEDEDEDDEPARPNKALKAEDFEHWYGCRSFSCSFYWM